MAFLDNSGDIILDAVLTDHGRKVLAKGDGSFKITKFALGDEEVNYTLYNSSHASGSAYYDLEILQTPILESFTNNASSMKTQLLTYDNMELLFLPVLKLNENDTNTQRHSTGAFVVAVDDFTEQNETDGIALDSAGAINVGFLRGEALSSNNHIRVDQGLDTNQVSALQGLDSELVEDTYTISIDGRLGSLVSTRGDVIPEDYTDDDNIKYYTVSTTTDGELVVDNSDTSTDAAQTIEGPRGTIVQFKIKASAELNTSTFLFTQLGSTVTQTTYPTRDGSTGHTIYIIDSTVRVTGKKTGYSIDIPVRFAKNT
tara:strand:- start:2387 stop:3328 length:942 start_codon:yes stop_codon:yes gene_type:complete